MPTDLATLLSPEAHQAMTQVFQKDVWGDLYEYSKSPNAVCSVHMCSGAVPNGPTISFYLEVRLKPARLLYPSENGMEVWGRIQEGKSYGMRKTLSLSELTAVQVRPASILEVFLRDVPKDLAPRLFEWDPRIGFEHQVGDPLDWPRCPLFDFPGGVLKPLAQGAFTNPYPPEWEALWCRCGRCTKPFEPFEPVTWKGGNLRWVCPNCTEPGRPVMLALP